MYFITTKRMLEVCFFQHTPTFIIEPIISVGYWAPTETICATQHLKEVGLYLTETKRPFETDIS